MDSKQFAGRINFDLSFLELTNLLSAAHHKKSVEHLKNGLNDVYQSCTKESPESASEILSLLGQYLNPHAYRIADLLINQLKELELLNRRAALGFEAKHLGVLNDQKSKLSKLIDQSMAADNVFKCEGKNAKITEDRQALWAQFGTRLSGQLEEIFRSDSGAFPADREQIDLKIKKEYLTGLLPIVEQFVKQRIELIEKRDCDNLKELFNRAMVAFEDEFKRCFSSYSKMRGQLQKDQLDTLLKNKETVDQQQFKENFASLKANMLLKLEALERSYNEEVKSQLSSLAKDLSAKITATLQQTSDLILERSGQLIESNQSSHPTRSTYQQILIELFSFKELIDSVPIPRSSSTRKKQTEEFKAKTKELFGKICAHRFRTSELAKLKPRPKSAKRKN